MIESKAGRRTAQEESDDVDAHFARARSAGATIVAEPEDMFWGDRTYVAEDPERHRWTFAQHVRDVSPEDMKPPA